MLDDFQYDSKPKKQSSFAKLSIWSQQNEVLNQETFNSEMFHNKKGNGILIKTIKTIINLYFYIVRILFGKWIGVNVLSDATIAECDLVFNIRFYYRLIYVI